MNIKQLKLYNFWSHKNTTINFDKDFYMILGNICGSNKSNGSGKSTISRSIAYALYGDASDEIKNDNAIYNDAKKMGVMLSFELNGIYYIIKRKLIRGSSPSIHIQIGDSKEVKYGVKAGQSIINEILGADFSIYKNTNYFKQGDISSFSTLTPKEAKEVVIKILQLDIYNNYEKIAKDKSKETENDILSLKNTIKNLENQINEENVQKDKPKTDYVGLNKLEHKLKDLKSKKSNAETSINLRNKTLDEIEKKGANISKFIDQTKYKSDDLKRRIQKLRKLSGKCPTCEHDLNEEIKKSIILGLEKALKPINEQLDIYYEELKKVQEEEKEAKNIPIDSFDYESQISNISYRIGETRTQLNQIKENERKLQNLRNKLHNTDVELKNKQKWQKIYNGLNQAFGKNGIQAYIIENVIPEIQATTNDILGGLDTDIRINIESQKILKKGGKAETLDINVITQFGERPYTNYSGGEKTFIDFALRIALSVILTRRSKSKIQTLILDEVFGELDIINKRIISKALRFIANRFDFKKILIISHAEELQDSFENVIRIVHDGESSHVIKEKENEKSIQHI